MVSMMNTTNKRLDSLKEGKWYAIGFMSWDGRIDYGPLYQYIGAGQFLNEYGETVESLWDPLLQAHVAVDSADSYQEQV
jgi:hypothetical protein